jgi:hypothetical protein
VSVTGQRDLVYVLFEALVHPNTLARAVRYIGKVSDFSADLILQGEWTGVFAAHGPGVLQKRR